MVLSLYRRKNDRLMRIDNLRERNAQLCQSESMWVKVNKLEET